MQIPTFIICHRRNGLCGKAQSSPQHIRRGCLIALAKTCQGNQGELVQFRAAALSVQICHSQHLASPLAPANDWSTNITVTYCDATSSCGQKMPKETCWQSRQSLKIQEGNKWKELHSGAVSNPIFVSTSCREMLAQSFWSRLFFWRLCFGGVQNTRK